MSRGTPQPLRGEHAERAPVLDAVASIDSLFDAADRLFGVDTKDSRRGRARASAPSFVAPGQPSIRSNRTLGRGNAWTVTEATSETGVKVWLVQDGNGGVAICNSPEFAEAVRSRL